MTTSSTGENEPVFSAASYVIPILLVAGLLLIGSVVVLARDVVLIIGLAILFGVFLTKSSHTLSQTAGVAYQGSLAAVAGSLIVASLLVVIFAGFRVDQHIGNASQQLEQAHQAAEDAARRYSMINSAIQATPVIRDFFNDLPETNASQTDLKQLGESSESEHGHRSDLGKGGLASSGSTNPGKSAGSDGPGVIKSVASRAMEVVRRVFETTLGLVVNSLLIFFVGLFLAISPGSYRDGIVILFPLDRRDRIREVLDQIGDTLWSWLIGRFGSMLVTGIGAGLLLFFLGVPMALSLGLLTALLTFVPNIGGLIAVMLSVVFALPQGGSTVAMVVGGFVVLQLIESYVITPLIQQSQTSLPPALLIAFQAVLGVAFGFLGAAIASPLLAACKVAAEELYVRDFLDAKQLDD